MSTESSELEMGVLTVSELLSDKELAIPEYQRPYKWTSKNIKQLFSDIARYKEKRGYRLGAVVFHQESGKRNIVDGQQRIVTLMLAILALNKERLPSGANGVAIKRPDLQKKLDEMKGRLEEFDPRFDSTISQANIRNNYQAICRIVTRQDFDEQLIEFLLYKCKFVYFVLNDISEAFQFFDSQNARGRDLEPHDLLKAFHLREFTSEDECIRTKSEVVSDWESCDTDDLARLFSKYLYRIRSWSRGSSARYFTKQHTHLFKGVNIDRIERYPYVEQLRIAHQYVDEYNCHYHRDVDGNSMGFPFHIDQTIINGRRFFELIGHYRNMISKVDPKSFSELQGFAPDIIDKIDKYEARHRTGDRYVRSLFDCLLIMYIDKFGMVEISRAIEKCFIWAYGLRLKMQVLQLASMDNYVLDNNMFVIIKESTHPSGFLGVELPVVKDSKGTNISCIQELFMKMGYHE